MTKLSLNNLAKAYGGKPVLRDIRLDVPQGQLVSLLGPSGCGKTTTLNIVAGFLAPDEGQVLIGGTDVTKQPPYRRDTAVVFQNYALFPHMRVFDNVAYGLRAQRVAKHTIPDRVDEALSLVGITDLADRYPAQLSGGQQQRVAVARAVAVRPGVLLMDEPLSNLDAKLRIEIRLELRSLQRRLNQTVLFVTHDQEEALSISDSVVLMNGGGIEQMGTPEELFEHPQTVFAAKFMGVENIFEGAAEGERWVGPGGIILPVPGRGIHHVGIRPGRIGVVDRESASTTSSRASVEARVIGRTYLGTSVRYLVEANGVEIVATVPHHEARFAEGAEVSIRLDSNGLLPLDRDPEPVDHGPLAALV
jgi:putative spermidine/putrescine transport system ATP-binding protein